VANEIHVCIDRVLPPPRQIDAARRGIAESPANVPILRPGFGVAPPTPLELAAITGKLWQIGRTLHVRFLDGSPQVQSKVAQVASEWGRFANIHFAFDDSPDAEIRISFTRRGSWSYIGVDALAIPRNQPTMNFGWLTPASSDEEYQRVVLHEFGHVLGCIHEHQNPAGDIPWDKEAVYAYYAGPPNNWSREEVDVNLFQKYSRTITQFSEFDKYSIMLYPIPNAHTIGDFEVGWNGALSPTDKSFVGVLYPMAAKPIVDLIVDDEPTKAAIGEKNEQDLFRFAVTTARRYRIETRGWTDVVVTLFGADTLVDRLAEDDDSGMGFNAKIVCDLQPGTYYVQVRHFRPKGTGEYEISVVSMS